MEKPKIKLYSFTLDCVDTQALAKFYSELLGWQTVYANEEFAVVADPTAKQGEYPGITLQKNENYLPPVWPANTQMQQQMAHLDFAVNDLEKSVKHAVSCGAKIAENQFSDSWKVMFDPAGHPFCLCLIESAF